MYLRAIMYLNRQTEEVFRQFRALSTTQLQDLRDELDEALYRNHFYMKGFSAPIPVQLNSVFLTNEQQEALFAKSRHVLNAIAKLVDEYFRSAELRELIGLDEFESALLLEAVRPKGIGMMRLDAFWDGEEFKFVELNADYPEGVIIFQNMCDTYDKVMGSHGLLGDEFMCDTDNRELFYQNALASYRANGGAEEKPTVAVIGPLDRLFVTEYELIASFFQEKGHKAFLAEPHRFSLGADNSLLYGDTVVDIVRRAGETRYFKRDDTRAAAVFDAYRAGTVTLLNSFHDRLWGIKSMFAALRSDDYAYLFSNEERTVIDASIPETYVIPFVEPHVLEHKDDYVLKPSDLSEGEEITFGKAVTPAVWNEMLHDKRKRGWTVQKVVALPKRPVIDSVNGKKVENELYTDFMVHVFRTEEGLVFGNIGNRTSQDPVVNVAKGGGINQVKTRCAYARERREKE